MTVQCYNISQWSRQAIVNRNLTPAGLIQDRHLDIIPERSLAFHQHNIYILDKAVITDPVISDIILYVLDQHIIPQRTIMQGNMTKPAMLYQSSRQGKHLTKGS